MNEYYLIPANSKKSLLYFSAFRMTDLIILGTGILITVILLFAIQGDTIKAMLIKLGPAGIASLLVMPIPYYHNVLVFFTEIYNYLMSRKVYLWKGWCISHESKES